MYRQSSRKIDMGQNVFFNESAAGPGGVRSIQ
jgi:hypothetical protein